MDANIKEHTVAEIQHPSSPGHSGGEKNPLLKLDPGMAIWTWVVFLLLLIIMGKFAWKPILKSLDEREDRIKKSLEDAEKARQELEQLAEKQKDMIAEAEYKGTQIVQKARESAQNLAMEIETHARRESEHMVEAARNAIESQKQVAVKELRNEAANMAVMAASKLLQANLDNEQNRKLVDGYIKDISTQA
ncbi:MAG: F0F1 ATP synthase subunit B [bacterium]